jgi:hypothetical protein
LTRWRNGCEIIETSKAGARPFPYGTWTKKLPSKKPTSGVAGRRQLVCLRVFPLVIYEEGALHLTGVIYEFS